MSNVNKKCGIECKFSKQNDMWSFLRFDNIDFKGFHFSVQDSSLIISGGSYGIKKYTLPDDVEPDYFKNLFKHRLNAERLVLHLYPSDAKSEMIDSYTDYLKSRCELIILVYDGYYLELYCKNREWLDILTHTVKSIPGTIVSEKYEETDTRYEMWV